MTKPRDAEDDLAARITRIAPVTDDALRRRGVLLLQGPVGPFFARLGRRLVSAGIPCRRVVFNAADEVFSGRWLRNAAEIRVCREGENGWAEWLAEELDRAPPAVVVLFGCERDRHATARHLCAEAGIPVLCLEEGYVRPGYVTAEWGGNNRLSPIGEATLPQIKAAQGEALAPAAHGHAFRAMAMWGAFYYTLRVIGMPFFPATQHHKDRPLIPESFRWLRNPWRNWRHSRRNHAKALWLIEHLNGRFYVVPLQVRDDMQLVKAGRGWTNDRLIEKTIASFARHAPADRHLVIKVHPLERGHSDALERTRHLAARHGVADRVVALDGESIGLLTSASAGMITVNSTSAFSAMHRHVPLGVLGDAMFRRDDLAVPLETPRDIDAFWRCAKARPRRRLDAFLHYMSVKALVPGDYYRRDNAKIAARNIVDKIEREWRAAATGRDPVVEEEPLAEPQELRRARAA